MQVLETVKIGNDEYRIIETDTYKDICRTEIESSSIIIQKKKKCVFKYWSFVKEYNYKNTNTRNIQINNARRFINKLKGTTNG